MDFLFCGTSGNVLGGEHVENAQTEQDIMERYAQFIASRQASRQTSEPAQQSPASEQAPEIITPTEGSFRDLKEFTRQLWDSVFSPADEIEPATMSTTESNVDHMMELYSLRKENTDLKNRIAEMEETIKKIIG